LVLLFGLNNSNCFSWKSNYEPRLRIYRVKSFPDGFCVGLSRFHQAIRLIVIVLAERAFVLLMSRCAADVASREVVTT